MYIIQTEGDVIRVLDSPLDPELEQILATIADRLAECPDFGFEELAEIIVVEAGETLDGICSVTGQAIATDGKADFMFPVELIVRHPDWFEITFILDDFGFGLVLLIEIADTTDATLLGLCTRELERYNAAAS